MSKDTRAITVGIDGSRASLDAADWAAREAHRRHLALRLLHAGADPAGLAQLPDGELSRTTLDRVAVQLAYAHPALDIIARRTETPAIPALLAAAAESEALALGSRGFSDFAGFLVGSVALAVASRAARPAVLVRAGELPEEERVPVDEETPPAEAPYLPVVLGLDLADPADGLIGYAFDTAAVRAAPLHVVHAWTPPPSRDHTVGARTRDDTAEQEDVGRRSLAVILQPWRHKFPETTVLEQVVHGFAGHHLLKASTRAGLLVIGRRDTAGPRLGRVAHFVIHHCACPVAVVPHD
ncbi:universal stress protein [Streptomyces sp. HC44]|uniref:Universal stress protein n=1 Tax=Streptomyces scabichelini TaxID=2711217 RepID=A0A6G4V6H9_9ACTN|nr:universal stress protein [Streptomyces scabichelini]NGO09443.1 universal stress protein [Streptomyces scabichelini]